MIELLFTIMMMAVLISIAVPSFQNAAQGSQLRAMANDLVASAYLARGEAIKRNGVVTFCASSNGTTCAGNWHDGWIVVCRTNDNPNNPAQPPRCIRNGANQLVLQSHPATPNGYEIRGTTRLTFDPTGLGARDDVTNGNCGPCTLTVCRATPEGSERRVVEVDITGRPKADISDLEGCPA